MFIARACIVVLREGHLLCWSPTHGHQDGIERGGNFQRWLGSEHNQTDDMQAQSKASAIERRLAHESEEPPRKKRLATSSSSSQGQSWCGHEMKDKSPVSTEPKVVNLSDVRGDGGEERTGRSLAKIYRRPMISKNAVTPSPDEAQNIRELVSRTSDSTSTPRDGLFDDPYEKLRSPRRLFSDRKLSLRGMESAAGRTPAAAVKPFVRAQRNKRQMAPRPTPNLHQVLKRRRLCASASPPRVVGGRSREETPPVSRENIACISKATEDKGINTDRSLLHDKGVQVDAAGMIPFTFMPDARIDPLFRDPEIVGGDQRSRLSPSSSVYNKPSPIIPREPSHPIMIRPTMSPRDSTSGFEGGLAASNPRETDELGVPFDFMSSQSVSNLNQNESHETLPACPPSLPRKVALGVKYIAASTVNWMLNRNRASEEERVRGAVEVSREKSETLGTTNDTLSSLSESCSDYVLYTSPPSKPSGQLKTRRQSFESSPLDEAKGSNEFVIKHGLPQKPPPSGWETMFQPKGGGWKCNKCFFKNPPEAMTCDSCTALREDGRKVQPCETELDAGDILEDYDDYFEDAVDDIEADEVKDGEGKLDAEVDGRQSESGDVAAVPDVNEQDEGSDQEEISGPSKRMKASLVTAPASPARSTKPRGILKTPGRIQVRAAASTYDAEVHHVMETRDTIDEGDRSLTSLQRASSPAAVDEGQGLTSLRRAASTPATVHGSTSLQRAAAVVRANFSSQSDAPATPGGRSTASDTDGSPMSTISDGSEGYQAGAGKKKMRRDSPNRSLP